MTDISPNQAAVTQAAERLEQTIFEVKKIIVGQDRVVERLLVCLLAKGHALLEGVPGLAKTLAAETIAVVVGGTFHRIQFTPDLLPADVMGTRIYRSSTETFDVELGPVFANFVLADEINRSPAKVQSALLEVMAEYQVTIGGETFPVPRPFLVLATQNPIEQEGVYPLPEAQRDRFLMKIVVDYPTVAEEVEIVQRMGVRPPEASPSLTIDALAGLQTVADSIFVAREVVDYAVSLVFATRQPDRYGLADLNELVSYGASPRASLGLVAAGRALALMRGRTYVLPQDVFDVAPDVLRHRLVLSYEALARDIGVDDVLGRLLSTVPAPRVTPSQDPTASHLGSSFTPSSQTTPSAPSWAGHGDPTGPVGWGQESTSNTGWTPPPPVDPSAAEPTGTTPWEGPGRP
ncbi:MAG: MoxR family ATPase [Acidimicrobiales bacterium]|nr:MoxR family ATPase [Acidimicrobiales bacterium]